MSIVAMYGFDHWPEGRALDQNTMIAEGQDSFSVSAAYSQAVAGLRNGRNRLVIGPLGNGPSFGVWKSIYLYNNVTLRTIFGNPSVVTSGVIGFRITITADGKAVLDNGNTTSACCLFLFNRNYLMDQGLIKSLPQGEHFLEYEFDFVAKKVDFYIDGTFKSSYTSIAFTLDYVVYVGFAINTHGAYYVASYDCFHITDFYATYDNQNGEVSGRLGPVLVRSLPATIDTAPNSWSVDDDGIIDYIDQNSQTFKGQSIVPKAMTEGNNPGQFVFTSNPLPASGSAETLINDSSVGLYWASTSVPLYLTFSFNYPKRVMAYSLRGSSTVNGQLESWVFQGSNDGAQWVDLDTQVNKSIPFRTTQYATCTFKLAPDKIGSYQHYRLKVTAIYNISSKFYLRCFQLLGDPADAIANCGDLPSHFMNSTLSDLDYPVLKTGLAGEAARLKMAVPAMSANKVLAVKVGIMGRREQGASEVLQMKTTVGAAETAFVDIPLQAHSTALKTMPLMHKRPDGAAWTKDDLAAMRLVVKSKRGDN